MVNERLVEYLEMHGVFVTIQCGCRRNRSALDNLVRLESEVRKCFDRSKQLVLVFFDLEKHYDMTWKHGIVQDLRSAGLEGYLPRYMQECLKNVVFQVRIGCHQSDVKPQIN